MAENDPEPAGGDTPPPHTGGGESGTPRDRGQNNVLSLSQLVGAPIRALVEAEAQAALTTAAFIRDLGFAGGVPDQSGDLGELQMVRFRRHSQRPDGTDDAYDVAIPLLSLLPIPALQIRDAELDFTIKIVATEATGEHRREMLEKMPEGAEKPAERPATLRATFAREQRGTRQRSTDMLLKMKVNMEQCDLPDGLSKLLNLASESVSQRRTGGGTDTAPEPEE